MKKNKEGLQLAINEYQIKQETAFFELKSQFSVVYESIKPINIINSTLEEVSSQKGTAQNIRNNLIGMAAGYLSKLLIVGSSQSPLKKLFGTFLQAAVTNIATKYAGMAWIAGEKFIVSYLNQNTAQKDIFIPDESFPIPPEGIFPHSVKKANRTLTKY